MMLGCDQLVSDRRPLTMWQVEDSFRQRRQQLLLAPRQAAPARHAKINPPYPWSLNIADSHHAP